MVRNGKWNLILNECKVIKFVKCEENKTIVLNGESMSEAEEVKHVGVTVTENLSLEETH